jgi:hypothetical protein
LRVQDAHHFGDVHARLADQMHRRDALQREALVGRQVRRREHQRAPRLGFAEEVVVGGQLAAGGHHRAVQAWGVVHMLVGAERAAADDHCVGAGFQAVHQQAIRTALPSPAALLPGSPKINLPSSVETVFVKM